MVLFLNATLRYSINVTLDGCCDHRAICPDEEMHRHVVENLNRADIKSRRNKEWKDEADPSRDSTKDSESVRDDGA
jgi:hypothetical protein